MGEQCQFHGCTSTDTEVYDFSEKVFREKITYCEPHGKLNAPDLYAKMHPAKPQPREVKPEKIGVKASE